MLVVVINVSAFRLFLIVHCDHTVSRHTAQPVVSQELIADLPNGLNRNRSPAWDDWVIERALLMALNQFIGHLSLVVFVGCHNRYPPLIVLMGGKTSYFLGSGRSSS